MSKSKCLRLLLIALGGFIICLGINGWQIKESLQKQPPIYMTGCSDFCHGLYALNANLDESKTLTLEKYDVFAGIGYHKSREKVISYVEGKGIIEYDLVTRKNLVLVNEKEMTKIEDRLKPEKTNYYDFYYINYAPGSGNISFVYGSWAGSDEGTLCVYNREEKYVEKICKLNTKGGYYWTPDTKKLYYIRDNQVFCKDILSGQEERIIENATRFAVSESRRYITAWREKKYENVSSYGLYLYDCENGRVKHIANSSIEAGAFYGCEALTEIEIPDHVTEIGYGAFQECTGLQEVKFPQELRDIGENAFFKCSSLKSVNLPNGVTNIGYGAFESCGKLQSIVIPNGNAKLVFY